MKDFLGRNSSTILTVIGAFGVVATSVMAVKATPKVLDLLEDAKEEKGEELTKLEKFKIAAPKYIPTVITGAATIACIFGSNIINKRQQASLMSAYALVDQAYKDYKKKVDELYGEEAGEKVREEIAKDKYAGDGTLEDDNKELFYDFYSGRFFEATREDVIWAEYELNRALSTNGSVCVNEFYGFIGAPELKPLPEYEQVGWTYRQIEEMYWHSWIEFGHETTIIDNDSDEYEGLECTIVNMLMDPVVDYMNYDEW